MKPIVNGFSMNEKQRYTRYFIAPIQLKLDG